MNTKKAVFIGLKLLVYLAMLALICVFFSGAGEFIYEAL